MTDRTKLKDLADFLLSKMGDEDQVSLYVVIERDERRFSFTRDDLGNAGGDPMTPIKDLGMQRRD